jgi:hypothetical protein
MICIIKGIINGTDNSRLQFDCMWMQSACRAMVYDREGLAAPAPGYWPSRELGSRTVIVLVAKLLTAGCKLALPAAAAMA